MSTGKKRVIEELLGMADVRLDGRRPWDIRVNDRRFYGRVLSEASLGLGESYMEGWWDCEAVDEMVCRVLRARLQERVRGNWKYSVHFLMSRLINMQSVTRAFDVGRRHYDIGNDLYERMLGPTMAYTCAYWRGAPAGELDAAQRAKFDLVCRKLALRKGQRVLELGCGFGSFARHAAERYGVEIVGHTVSREQAEYGRRLCRGLPVEIRLEDYRSASGQYDVVLSIGIMEHIGHKNHRTYMEVAHRCLKENGLAFIHTIGNNFSRTSIDPWIHNYIFPGATLPSIAQLAGAMEGLFVMEDLHNIGPDYDPTLMGWLRNFDAAWPELAPRYDETFRRMWRYYLMSCAGGFRARFTQLWQMVMTRNLDYHNQPDCRLC